MTSEIWLAVALGWLIGTAIGTVIGNAVALVLLIFFEDQVFAFFDKVSEIAEPIIEAVVESFSTLYHAVTRP